MVSPPERLPWLDKQLSGRESRSLQDLCRQNHGRRCKGPSDHHHASRHQSSGQRIMGTVTLCLCCRERETALHRQPCHRSPMHPPASHPRQANRRPQGRDRHPPHRRPAQNRLPPGTNHPKRQADRPPIRPAEKTIAMRRLSKIIPLGLVALLLFFIFPVFAYTGNGGTTVYVTETGGRYHVISCSYLRKSCYDIALEDAIVAGYTRCTVCCPPSYTGTAKPGDPKPVSDSSGSSGITTKETQDFSWLEDYEIPTWVPPTFEPRNFAEESYSYPYTPNRETKQHKETDPESEHVAKIILYCFWSFAILLLIAPIPAVKLSKHYNSPILHPYEIGCAAPCITLLGCILFKWSGFVFLVVLIISIIIIVVPSAIYSKRH